MRFIFLSDIFFAIFSCEVKCFMTRACLKYILHFFEVDVGGENHLFRGHLNTFWILSHHVIKGAWRDTIFVQNLQHNGETSNFPKLLHIFMFWNTKFSRFLIKLDIPSRFSWSSFFTSVTNYNYFVKTCSKFESVSWCYSLRVNRSNSEGEITLNPFSCLIFQENIAKAYPWVLMEYIAC